MHKLLKVNDEKKMFWQVYIRKTKSLLISINKASYLFIVFIYSIQFFTGRKEII